MRDTRQIECFMGDTSVIFRCRKHLRFFMHLFIHKKYTIPRTGPHFLFS